MAKINGIVYVLVGAAVSFFSNFVNQKTGSKNLMLFFYVGIIFIAIGVFKLVLWFILKKGEDTDQITESEPYKIKSKLANFLNKDLAKVQVNQLYKMQQVPRVQRIQQIQQMQQPQVQNPHSIIVCPRCGTRHYATSNFCHKCGTPLRKNI